MQSKPRIVGFPQSEELQERAGFMIAPTCTSSRATYMTTASGLNITKSWVIDGGSIILHTLSLRSRISPWEKSHEMDGSTKVSDDEEELDCDACIFLLFTY